jgi:hypothetical protein
MLIEMKLVNLKLPLITSLFIIIDIAAMICLSACTKHSTEYVASPYGTITLNFSHLVDDMPLRKSETIYTNAAGNVYQVTDLMYFISDVTLYRHDGRTRVLKDPSDILYVDDAIPSTLIHTFKDRVEPGDYDSVSFIFGIREAKNKSYLFLNPPEVIMSWPQVLGGGYHYIMLNGKWLDTNKVLMPFNFHLGIGQLYKGNTYNTDSIYAFVQNYFRVSLPASSFTLNEKDTLICRLTMNLERWFDTPHVFDFNVWGGNIMQNQAAMQTAKENGVDVFTFKVEGIREKW